MKRIVVALLLVATPALAQSPSDRAYQQTVQELTQAWLGARTAFLGAQDEIKLKDEKIKELQDRLPRQEPVKGPSGVGANVPKPEAP